MEGRFEAQLPSYTKNLLDDGLNYIQNVTSDACSSQILQKNLHKNPLDNSRIASRSNSW